jgi:hypothetical protein
MYYVELIVVMGQSQIDVIDLEATVSWKGIDIYRGRGQVQPDHITVRELPGHLDGPYPAAAPLKNW